LSWWEIDRAAESCCASPFLERFVSYNLMGHGMSKGHWARWNGIDLALVTKTSLADATDRFTKSVERLPATIYLTLNLRPDDGVQEAAPAEPEEAAAPPTEAEKRKTELEDLADRLGDFIGRVFPGTNSTEE
jgi:hypothetical protein